MSGNEDNNRTLCTSQHRRGVPCCWGSLLVGGLRHVLRSASGTSPSRSWPSQGRRTVSVIALPSQATPPGPSQARWRPELEKIVAKVTRTFSRSFAKIGCAGEVALHIAEVPGGGVDYNKCAINIKCGLRAWPACTAHTFRGQATHPTLGSLKGVR